MSEPVKTWRYSLPSENHEGWAIIHMDSKGFFATCSDFGNYAFHWSDWGKGRDFRLFVIEMTEDPHYIGNKLNHDKWNKQDDQETATHIKKEIISRRRNGTFDKDVARENWDYLEHYDSGSIDFREWIQNQTLFDDWSEASDCAVSKPSGDIWCFCTKTLVRLAEILKAELAAEAISSVESKSQTAQPP